MSIKLSSIVWELDLPLSHKTVALCLADFADDRGLCFPSVGRVAWKTGLSERHVQRIMRELAVAGILRLVKRADGGRGLPRVYRLSPRKGAMLSPFSEKKGDICAPKKRVTSATERVTSATERVTSATERVTPMSPEPSVEPSVEPQPSVEPSVEPLPGKHRRAGDSRHQPIREAIDRAYRLANGVPAPWGPGEAGALGLFLRSNPALTPAEAEQCIRHRFMSECSYGDPPRLWIANLPSYLGGPLDRYGKPKRLAPTGAAEGRGEQRKAEALPPAPAGCQLDPFAEAAWAELREQLEESLGARRAAIWVAPLRLLGWSGDRLAVAAPGGAWAHRFEDLPAASRLLICAAESREMRPK